MSKLQDILNISDENMCDDRHPWWESGHGEAYCPNCERDNKRLEELEALLVRILVAGNARPPTKLLEDIRAAIGEVKK